MAKSKSEKKKKYWDEEKNKYKNQESFTIDKKVDTKSKNYFILEQDALWPAFQDLTPTELAFYLYTMKNSDGVVWNFSMADCEEKTGYSSRALRDAKHGLKKKGYWDEEKQIFHQYPFGGKSFRQEAENLSKDDGKICIPNKITENTIIKNTDTSSTSAGSILDYPKEEEFIF